jgi:3-deoxy-manno-octulosonate cytidylyltransferase (CMP-KDO synthetase)
VKYTAVIPARYAASRFPGKLMKLLNGKPVIVHTYEQTVATGLFDDVLVVTDSDLIFSEITGIGGKVVRSVREHESGTDRIAEIAPALDTDVIINVQGDEPFVLKQPLQQLCRLFDEEQTQVASLMHAITDARQITDPNAVKVVVNRHMEALYFSRSAIPYLRDPKVEVCYYKHIGVYAYRKDILLKITQLPPTLLEQAEKLEQLRMLENGIRIKMALTEPWSISIDTPEDLERAEKIFSKKSV